MTVALIAANLSASASVELERDFGWRMRVLSDIRAPLPLGDGVDLSEVEALVIEAQPVTAEVLEALPRLRLLGCLRSEPVNVDLEAATVRGIPVVHTPARNRESVAEFVIGLMLSVTRHIATSHHLVVSRTLAEPPEVVAARAPRKDVIWRPVDPEQPIPYDVFRGPELGSLVLGLVGFGAIGRGVADKARALGMTVLAHDPSVSGGEIAQHGVEPRDLLALLAESDVVSLHARAAGPPILGRAELATMKQGAFLINTSRANQVDYEALAQALRDGHLAGAGLDVFPEEPIAADDPLLDLQNVTLTPHLAGASTNVIEHQSAIFLDGLRALANGSEAARRRVVRNPEVLEETR
jgi:D-3-phosphoglycerate dehydrogenase